LWITKNKFQKDTIPPQKFPIMSSMEKLKKYEIGQTEEEDLQEYEAYEKDMQNQLKEDLAESQS
jgi:hypothetical protein